MDPAPPTQPAAIALGSNLGDCRATLESALAALSDAPGIRVLRRSAWFRSAPVGPPQPDYLNGCALLEVSLAPEALLDRLLATEARFGRVRGERWGPRTLDLDLILFADLELNSSRLQIPHPRLRERPPAASPNSWSACSATCAAGSGCVSRCWPSSPSRRSRHSWDYRHPWPGWRCSGWPRCPWSGRATARPWRSCGENWPSTGWRPCREGVCCMSRPRAARDRRWTRCAPGWPRSGWGHSCSCSPAATARMTDLSWRVPPSHWCSTRRTSRRCS
ncbi:MAG: 2-amino-4-hydroxy-6-hydroxymethyldihydropteridine diphosphokinase [Synechococcaceae bacterium WB4_1_0192]|nr:2-amino-4-hydroxy-6-hydroxymethyldihydropteridine diphosphokinase [Synechococcaceae bacterium WB4_1_0192]